AELFRDRHDQVGCLDNEGNRDEVGYSQMHATLRAGGLEHLLDDGVSGTLRIDERMSGTKELIAAQSAVGQLPGAPQQTDILLHEEPLLVETRAQSGQKADRQVN